MTRVSVVVPVYGAEKYVAATIRSVLAQTHQNFEILIIDDGSPDRSVEVCQQFTDPRIRIIRQTNRGLSGARNTGIRNATGEYVALLDADDLWVPDKLEKHVQHLNSSPDVGISFSYSAFIDEAGKPTGLHQTSSRLSKITPAYILCRNPIGNGSTPVMRREVFETIKFQDDLYGEPEDCFFDERLRRAEDIDCWLRIATKTHWKFEGISEILTLYRISTGGLSADALKQLKALEQVIEKARSYAPNIIDACENTAKAYHLRYIARRAVTLRDADMGVKMLHQSLAKDWRILLQEPGRTLLTMSAVYLLWLLPRSLYSSLEESALRFLSNKHKLAKAG